MEKRLLCGEEVSLLGFGAMRLPTQEDGTIDRVKAGRLVDTLYQNGVNYFDTAYVYHQGESEEFLGEALRKYPRDSFYLATKTPGHLINPDYDPVEAFERQLRRCETDYFDFYLLHNVMESCRRIQILTCVSWITYWNRKPRDISVTWEFLRMGSCRCWKDT